MQQHALNQTLLILTKQAQHNTFSKPIIIPWEEINNNKHRLGLGYDKEVTFHIPNYSRPIQFQIYGFLQENSSSLVLVQHQCQHCHQIGHMEDQCFSFHPCQHCEKHIHSSDRCSTLKKSARVKIHH